MCTGLEMLALAGTGASAATDFASSQAQAATMEANARRTAQAQQAQADLLERDADQRRETAAAEEQEFRRAEDRRIGSLRARLGGSGAQVGTGTGLDVAEDTAAEIELQALKIRHGGEVDASRLEHQAGFARHGARDARRMGSFSASTTRGQGALRAGSRLIGGTVETFG